MTVTSDCLYANTSPDKKRHDKIKLRNIIWTDLFCFIKTILFIQNRLTTLPVNVMNNTTIWQILQEWGKVVENGK